MVRTYHLSKLFQLLWLSSYAQLAKHALHASVRLILVVTGSGVCDVSTAARSEG